MSTLSDLRQATTTAQRLATNFANGTTAAGLNRVTYTGKVALPDMPVADLQALIAAGHLVDLRIRMDAWRLHLRRGGTDGEVTDTEGPLSAAVDQARIDELDAAITAKEFEDILVLLQAHDAEVTLQVINDPEDTGTHWLPTHQTLTEVLASPDWVPVARQLSSGPTRLLIDDLEDAVLTTGAVTIHGPQAASSDRATVSAKRRESVKESDEPFRRARAGQNDAYPSPLPFTGLFQQRGNETPATTSVIAASRRLTYLLAWALLATSSRPIAGGVHVSISGARELDIDIQPATDPETSHLVDLYRWVATSPEIDRLYFAQQAITLAVVSPADATTAAEPALRTAKSLYDLSRRHSVAEVMSARRSAREIALAASRSAASQARESAAKAVERTVIQVAAAAGVVIAQLQKGLSAGQAAGLIGLIGFLCLVTALVTDWVSLHSARTGLDKELEDLDRYRDSLSEEDVDDLKTVGAITAAKSDLRRARVTTWLAFGLAVLALVIAAFVINGGSDKKDDKPESPVPTNTMTTPTPTTAPSRTTSEAPSTTDPSPGTADSSSPTPSQRP